VTQDVFGTGSGPRAYAIIGCTISRIIESKPEELRLFLEEAAGSRKHRTSSGNRKSRLLTRVENSAWKATAERQSGEAGKQAEVARYNQFNADVMLASTSLSFEAHRVRHQAKVR
jgi:chromosome segregation ATPase